ncbi:hypothetical protein D9757_012635 [Collybiopsis confluens]|uniref:Mediator of RNA polymerase II transcription subunit 13 n=1 Tax=Collybiopsis confluens TaxID=2823264 RepID=A0A8H5FWL3_9AGAR|nr:hypothetical protein D9757_012635 [Collybiopsis confluens]
MNDINMNMNGGTSGLGGDNMDMDMALFGVDSGSSLNLDDLGWNMGSAFGFESGLGSAVAATAITGGSELGPLALQSANAFAQPIPPPMTRSVTAPTTVPQTAVSTHHSSGSGSGSGLGIGAMDFEDITDDDFSFFDNKPTMPTNQSESSSVPSAAPMIVLSQPSASAPPAINSSGTPSNTTGLSDSLAFLNNEESFFQSLGLPPPLPIGSAPTPYPSHSTPGRGGITASGFTPLTVDIEVEMEMDPGLPSPPAEDGDRTNPSKDVIKVQLDDNTDSPPPSLSSPLHPEPVRPGFSRLAGAGSSMPLMPLRDKKFSAIPFAKSHLVADSKYRVSGGKFALLRSSSGWIHNHKLSPRPRSIASGDREGKLQPSPTLKEQETNINKAELARGAWALPSPPVDSDDAESSSDDSTSGDEDDDLPLAVVTGITPRLPLPVTSSAEDSPVQLRSGTKNLTPQPSTRQAPRRHRGWRPKYDRATDPRIGVVKKLARQKIRSALATRDRRPRWIRDWENETGRRVDEAGSVQIEEEDSEMDDDDDDDDDEGSAVEQDQLGHMDDESHQLEKTSRRDRSRPTTPLPGYLPPGPDLIATCFHWVHLDGISEGERTASNEDMMVQELHQTAHPQYDGILHGGTTLIYGRFETANLTLSEVPTPISPSAYMGGSTSASPAFVVTPGPSWNQSSPADTDPMKEGEKSRLTEANVFTIARECAENYVWADAWTTVDELVGDSGTTEYFKNDRSHPMNMQSYMEMSLECVGPNDVAAVKQLLAGTFSDTLLRVEDLFDVWAAIDVLPSALHFWDKLGLDPKSGKKNTTVLVVHDKNYLESDSMMDGSLGAARSWRFEQIQLWLKNVTELYKVKHYGEMTLGKSDSCDADGIASFKFDSSFEKNLASLIADFATPNGSLMFFVLVPLSSMTFTSESLRCLLSGVQRNHETYHEVQILFQFVPEPHVLNSPIHPSSPHDFRTASFLESVYNRILLPIDRAMSRPLFSYDGARVKNFFEAPSFTLARSLSDSKVKYSSAVNPPLDILDHHTLLHVGYQLSSCGRWILAACIDQRGEAHDIGVWSTQPYLSVDNKNEDATLDTTPVSDEMYMVGKVWDFGIQFAEKASVEWRIVFTKLGTVGSAELNAWMAHFSTALYSIAKNARTPVHASLLSVEHSTPWMFLPPTSQSALPSSKGPSLSRSTSGSNKTSTKSQIFIDTSMTAYNIFHKALIPTTPPPTLQDVGLASDFVINSATLIDHDDHSLADGQSVLPLSSSALLQTPPSSSHSLARHQMINIHLLYAAKSEGCSYPTITAGAADSPQSLLRDITDSFYSLAVLSNVKSTAVDGKTSLLPFHLSAVKTMRNALSVRGGADCV